MAQTVVLPQGLDLMKRSQLMGIGDSLASMSLNPSDVPLRFLDSIAFFKSPGKISIGKNSSLQFLPASLSQQLNSKLPYSWNIAPMIPAKGYQLLASTGVFMQLGKHITVQINPQLVYAGNSVYQNAPTEFVPLEWKSYSIWTNTIDMPERFGSKHYARLYPGQSSIRFNTGKLSFGISTENMWWGPGSYNALIMSNNAPGFLHFTANTIQPLHTGIGTFEGQVIAGKLDNSGYNVPGQYNVYDGQFNNQPKKDEWRYITGLMISWQPKWVKHLYLGMIKASYLYHSDIQSPLDVLPMQGFLGAAVTKTEKDSVKASLGSLFLRYLLPKEQAEFYLEYGRNDRALMPTGIFRNYKYRRGYVGGFRKLFNTRNNARIQLLVEFAQLQMPTGNLTLDPLSWYTHRNVRQGYTQDGRVLGAGIGPGSNSETLELSWIKGAKKLGVRLERLLHNADLYDYTFMYIQDYYRKWVDLSTTFNGEWNYKNFLFSVNLGFIRSNNYQWQVLRTDGNDLFKRGYDVFTVNGRASVAYRF
jgi:hypothetical protein